MFHTILPILNLNIPLLLLSAYVGVAAQDQCQLTEMQVGRCSTTIFSHFA